MTHEAIVAAHERDTDNRIVRLFRNGRSQAVRIPKEWEFDADEVLMRQLPDGRLLMMPAETAGLIEYLRTAQPWTGGEFIEGDENLPRLDEPELE